MPLDQRLTAKNLNKCLSAKMFRRHPKAYEVIDSTTSNKRFYEQWLDEADVLLRAGRFNFKHLIEYQHPVTEKMTHSAKRNDGFAEELVLNRINFILRKICKINFSDRHKITSQVKTILSGDFEGYVIKLDIEEFYESINNRLVEKKLIEDRLISEEIKVLITRLFKYYRTSLRSNGRDNKKGIPRGLSLSATISEYVMRDFDKSVRRLDGVYFYARYVDDILILCTKDHKEITSEVTSILSNGLTAGLKLKKQKEKALHIKNGNRNVWKTATCVSTGYAASDTTFEYLGYKFSLNSIQNYKKKIPKEADTQCAEVNACLQRSKKKSKKQKELRSDLLISISDKKINKLKARIGISFQSFKRTRDFNVLRKRLELLSGTYPLDKSRQLLDDGVSELKGGLCYTYPLVNDLGGLYGIDRMIERECKKLRIPSAPLGVSFCNNFKSKKFYNLSISEIKELRKVWKYAEVTLKKA